MPQDGSNPVARLGVEKTDAKGVTCIARRRAKYARQVLIAKSHRHPKRLANISFASLFLMHILW